MTLKQLTEQIEEAREHYSHAATRGFLDNLLVRLRNEGVSDGPSSPEPSVDRRFSEVNERIEQLWNLVDSLSEQSNRDRAFVIDARKRADEFAIRVANIECILGNIKAAL